LRVAVTLAAFVARPSIRPFYTSSSACNLCTVREPKLREHALSPAGLTVETTAKARQGNTHTARHAAVQAKAAF
jgi:hypothetical protein